MSMLSYRQLYLLIMLVMLSTQPVSATPTASTPPINPEALTRSYYQAFNDRNFLRIDELLAEEFEWASVANGERRVEIKGKDALFTWLTNYFEACPSCRSEILSLQATGLKVRVHERMHWQNSSGDWQQAEAKADYEFSDTGQLQAATYLE